MGSNMALLRLVDSYHDQGIQARHLCYRSALFKMSVLY